MKSHFRPRIKLNRSGFLLNEHLRVNVHTTCPLTTWPQDGRSNWRKVDLIFKWKSHTPRPGTCEPEWRVNTTSRFTSSSQSFGTLEPLYPMWYTTLKWAPQAHNSVWAWKASQPPKPFTPSDGAHLNSWPMELAWKVCVRALHLIFYFFHSITLFIKISLKILSN